MTINPGAVVLLVLGVAAVLVGLRGTQGAVFAAVTGHASTSAKSTSAANVQPAAQLGTAAPAYLSNAQV